MRSFEIYVQFPPAPGVEKDTPVRFFGYQIGRVTPRDGAGDKKPTSIQTEKYHLDALRREHQHKYGRHPL
jgi:hypothetical protein